MTAKIPEDKRDSAPRPTRPPGVPFLPLTLYGMGVACVLLGLSIWYSRWFASAIIRDNWFGTDIYRYIQFATDLRFHDRGHLHPLALLLYKVYGVILRGVSSNPQTLPLTVFALPVIGVTAFSVTTSAWLLGCDKPFHAGRHLGRVGLLMAVSSLWTLAPIPESHTLGGSFLLLEAACVVAVLRLKREWRADQPVPHLIRTAILCGLIAAGLSLTNLIFAGILLLPTLSGRMKIFVRSGVIAMCLLIATIPIITSISARLLSSTNSPIIQKAVGYAWSEQAYAETPGATTLQKSTVGLVFSQFGVPDSIYLPAQSKLSDTMMNRERPSLWSACGLLLWVAGIGLVWRQTEEQTPEKRITVCCLVALTMLCLFHSWFDPREAYMFSPHAWPLVVMPGLLALQVGAQSRQRLPVVCLMGAVLCLIVQNIRGFALLTELVHSLMS